MARSVGVGNATVGTWFENRCFQTMRGSLKPGTHCQMYVPF